MVQDRKLSVYIASAGAGKTHTLTGEYLRLALSNPDQPTYFRHIQAVTFTNKATAEMKERILKELHVLASATEQSPYRDKLLPLFGGDITKLQGQAQKVLWNMLLRYSDFRVKTIDSFFQEIIRAFSRELDLTGGYRVELDGGRAVNIAVDQLLSSQAKRSSKDKVTFKWLERIARQMIQAGRGHNIRKEINLLGEELLKEDIKRLSQDNELPTPEILIQMQEEFQRLIEQAKDLGRDGIAKMVEIGLTDKDFAYGKNGAISMLYHLESGDLCQMPSRAQKALDTDGEEMLFTKNASEAIKQRLQEYFRTTLKPILKQFSDLQVSYLTASIANTFLSSYGLIGAINETLMEVNRHQNTLLLSDAPSLIASIIRGSDGVPFIYEKLGERIQHQMIDEFQDTSALQYANFRPMLEENLANGCDNLIVGDVKQSIYRWRNSDSDILAEHIFEDFADQCRKITLQYNWRSTPEIIHFNNSLYRELTEQFVASYDAELKGTNQYNELKDRVQMFVRHYAEVEQEIPPKSRDTRGLVVVHESEWRENYDDEELAEDHTEYRDTTSKDISLAQIPEVLIDIQKRGYRASDIAILVRTNKSATQIAERLLAYPKEQIPPSCTLNFISEDALVINRSPLVRFVVASLRYANNLNDTLAERQWLELYQYFSSESVSEEDRVFIASVGRKSLYEVVESIYAHFGYLWQERAEGNELAYRLKLLDMALAFQQDQTADLGDFLDYWDERGGTEKITSNPQEQAIQIMTIHKSKGLGFPVVLIPFPIWKLEEGRTIIWSSIPTPPFNMVKKIPVPAKKELLNTYFAKDYLHERMDQAMDALNLLYVATTRAEKELHLWMPSPEKTEQKLMDRIKAGDDKRITSKLYSTLNVLQEREPSLFVRRTADDPIHIEGSPIVESSLQKKSDTQSSASLILTDMPSYEAQGRIAILRDGLEHFKEDSQLHHGRLMHKILDRIHTTEDVSVAIEYFAQRGEFAESERSSIHQTIDQLIHHPEVHRWFDGSGEIKTEIPIIGGGVSGSRRPDRLILYPDGAVEVVDYKFGTPRRSHFTQVKGYMTLLSQMGFSSVRGYLWYVAQQKIKQVN